MFDSACGLKMDHRAAENPSICTINSACGMVAACNNRCSACSDASCYRSSFWIWCVAQPAATITNTSASATCARRPSLAAFVLLILIADRQKQHKRLEMTLIASTWLDLVLPASQLG
jgi:hypothetical protein